MANGLGSFYVGTSGLQNAQIAMNTTANNLANVDTTGYVRQQVRFADKNYSELKKPSQSVNMQQTGLGVTIGDITHARDIFLDKAYRQENGRRGFYETCFKCADYVQDLFQELNGEEFKYSINDLWTSIQELSKDPANSTNQNLMMQKAELFISRSSSLYKELQNYQSNLNLQIEEQIKKINEIGDKIYELNVDIQKVEASHVEQAMTYRDERDRLLDELSEYGKISVSEDATGMVTVEFENTVFVDENRCYTMLYDTDKRNGFINPYWGHLGKSSEEAPVFDPRQDISTEYNSDIGSLKALITMRGNGYGRYTDMNDVESYEKIQDCLLMETEAEVDYLLHHIVSAINDVLCPNLEVNDDRMNSIATNNMRTRPDGSTVTLYTTTSGTMTDPTGTYNTLTIHGYDEDGNAFDVTVNTKDSKILDMTCDRDEEGNMPPVELFKRDGCERYTAVYDSEGNPAYFVYNNEDEGNRDSLYAIGSISINPILREQITKLPVYRSDGAVDYSLGDRLTAIWEVDEMLISPFDKVGTNFAGYYDKIISRIGTAGSVYKTSSESLENTVVSIDGQRQQVAGVSSDEELQNMIKYQSAYNAASRYITVISEMTELIVTGLK